MFYFIELLKLLSFFLLNEAHQILNGKKNLQPSRESSIHYCHFPSHHDAFKHNDSLLSKLTLVYDKFVKSNSNFVIKIKYFSLRAR